MQPETTTLRSVNSRSNACDQAYVGVEEHERLYAGINELLARREDSG